MSSIDALLARSRDRRRLPEPAIRKHIRERAQLSQADVAAALGVDRATVSRYESGSRQPRGAHLDAYLQVLDRLVAE